MGVRVPPPPETTGAVFCPGRSPTAPRFETRCDVFFFIPRFVSAGNYRPASLAHLTPPPDRKQVFEDIIIVIIIIIKETKRKLVAI